MLKALTLAARKRRFTFHADRFDAPLIKVRSFTLIRLSAASIGKNGRTAGPQDYYLRILLANEFHEERTWERRIIPD